MNISRGGELTSNEPNMKRKLLRNARLPEKLTIGADAALALQHLAITYNVPSRLLTVPRHIYIITPNEHTQSLEFRTQR